LSFKTLRESRKSRQWGELAGGKEKESVYICNNPRYHKSTETAHQGKKKEQAVMGRRMPKKKRQEGKQIRKEIKKPGADEKKGIVKGQGHISLLGGGLAITKGGQDANKGGMQIQSDGGGRNKAF